MTDNDADATMPRVGRDDPMADSGAVVTDNIAALKALFPSIVADGQVDFDVLRQLLGDVVEESEERYGLHWKGKRKARAFALTPTLATLRPAKTDSKDWDTTQNIVIEGDNLEVLKCLRRSYAGQVKLIYIDPPYNTGNDFVYPDNFTDSIGNYERLTGQRGADGAAMSTNKEASGRFHTDWLNMMYPRLMLAKELLDKDGVVFVSIDDAEASNLQACCNEIFGADNHIATMVWEGAFKNDADQIGINHEYIVVYAASVSSLEREWGIAKVEADKVLSEAARLRALYGDDLDAASDDMAGWYRANKAKPVFGHRRFRYFDANGLYKEDDPTAPGGRRFDLIDKRTGNVIPLRRGRGWAFDQDTFDRMVSEGRITFVTEQSIMVRRYFHETDKVTPQSVFYNAARSASERLARLMGQNVFDFPKDELVIQQVVEMASGGDDLVLDFFAGSGTTAHAMMALNAADGGNRRYILVQLPEPLDPANASQKTAADFCDKLGKPRTIAELTKERLRRAGTKIAAENPEKSLDTGFRVYKLATSNLKPWNPPVAASREELELALKGAIDNILPDRTEEDLLVELLLKTGIDLTLPMATRTVAGRAVHALGGGVLIVTLGEVTDADAEALGEGIADWQTELDPVRATTFYFRDSGFKTAAAKANVAGIIRQRLGARVERLASI